jgi:hypothetical protein
MKGRGMERYSKAAMRDACIVQSKADLLARGQWWQQRKPGSSSALSQWTAWLLMEKAGMPRELIAFVSYVDERHITHGLLVVKAWMVWPPYAARIEALMRQMPNYGTAHLPARGAPCAAQAG